MADSKTLRPAEELAAANTAHFPNESAAYRAARNALLAEEIELRRQPCAPAASTRWLDPGKDEGRQANRSLRRERASL